MRIEIIRCDWCGSEREYDPRHFTTITYFRRRLEWLAGVTEEYHICDDCNNAFVQFFITRAQKIDAE